ncbi:SDR family NAD(P)-dependent oxidoreductase [Curvivirga sp.]|uniref:SDR family NAD(P)-dependent oxidoreductase n=1 Tax=Curvivirga sp. TaxID=2856848 RepID=UPI003B5B6BE8
MSSNSLEGRLALVTGASRGIGYEVSKRLASEGAHVIALARTLGGLEELDDEIKATGGQCTIAQMDLSDHDRIDALGASLYERFGKLDILVGNAGMLGELTPVGHISPKVWDRVISINLTANYRLIRSLGPLLQQSDAGRAIFVSSAAVEEQNPFWALYTASKAGLEAMVMAYAKEMSKSNIKANIIHPGRVWTAMQAKAYPGIKPDDLPKPSEITDIFVKLASTDLEVTGEIFNATVKE